MKKLIAPVLVFISFLLFPYLSYIPFAILDIDPDSVDQLVRIIYVFLFDLIFVCFLIGYYRKELAHDFKDLIKNFKNYIRPSINYWMIGLFIMVVSNYLISIITKADAAANETAVRELIVKAPIYMIWATVIFAPLVEELIFRKTFRSLYPSKWVFVVMSGLIFGGLHVVTSFTTYSELLYIIPYGVLGSAFAYLYYKTNNIYNSIIMHAFHNGSLILLFILTK